MSMIAVAELEGERLPDEIVVSFFRQLMKCEAATPAFTGRRRLSWGFSPIQTSWKP